MIVGIYGGSFDPIHTGHSIVANFVAQCGLVDEVWLMVSRQNPLKDHATYAAEKCRLEMAGIVAGTCNNVKVCDIELRMPSPSYTIETLKHLKNLYPEHNFKIIIGSDSLKNFENWKYSKQIVSEFGVIVYPRPWYGFPDQEPEGMTFLNGAPEFGISSSLIREYIRDGWNINYFVPTEIADYIKKHKLYVKR